VKSQSSVLFDSQGLGHVLLETELRECYIRVLDEKSHIRGYEGRLDGGQVYPDDLSFGKFITELNGPDPGARGDVQHFPG